jgi:hypothetical protein
MVGHTYYRIEIFGVPTLKIFYLKLISLQVQLPQVVYAVVHGCSISSHLRPDGFVALFEELCDRFSAVGKEELVLGLQLAWIQTQITWQRHSPADRWLPCGLSAPNPRFHVQLASASPLSP